MGQTVDFKQRHMGRDLPFTGEVYRIEKILDDLVYHCSVTHSDGMLFALVPESNITAVH